MSEGHHLSIVGVPVPDHLQSDVAPPLATLAAQPPSGPPGDPTLAQVGPPGASSPTAMPRDIQGFRDTEKVQQGVTFMPSDIMVPPQDLGFTPSDLGFIPSNQTPTLSDFNFAPALHTTADASAPQYHQESPFAGDSPLAPTTSNIPMPPMPSGTILNSHPARNLPAWLSHHVKKLRDLGFGTEWCCLLDAWISMEAACGYRPTSVRLFS